MPNESCCGDTCTVFAIVIVVVVVVIAIVMKQYVHAFFKGWSPRQWQRYDEADSGNVREWERERERGLIIVIVCDWVFACSYFITVCTYK